MKKLKIVFTDHFAHFLHQKVPVNRPLVILLSGEFLADENDNIRVNFQNTPLIEDEVDWFDDRGVPIGAYFVSFAGDAGYSFPITKIEVYDKDKKKWAPYAPEEF